MGKRRPATQWSSCALCWGEGPQWKWQCCLGRHSGLWWVQEDCRGYSGRHLRLVEKKVSALLITQRISDRNFWKKNSYRNSKVAGLVYLQNILDNRLTTSPPISILKKMREDDIISDLVFVTTHWDRVELNQGIARERQFCRALEPLLAWGARKDRFDNETKTAWRILDALLSQTTWERSTASHRLLVGGS